MLAIKHILFPVDFSERCCGAVPFVRAMAQRFGARITLLATVSPFWQAGAGDPSATLMVDLNEVKRDLENRLNASFVHEFAGLTVDRAAEIADPAEAITRYAHTQGADLIVGPDGYGPFRTLLLGSVTARCCMTRNVRMDGHAYGKPPPSSIWRRATSFALSTQRNTVDGMGG